MYLIVHFRSRDGQKYGSTVIYKQLLMIWFGWMVRCERNRIGKLVAKSSEKEVCGWTLQNRLRLWIVSHVNAH